MLGLSMRKGLSMSNQNEERQFEPHRSNLESYILNHNISIGFSDENKTGFNVSAG